jgi:hypothetical protein
MFPYTVTLVLGHEKRLEIADWWTSGQINFQDMVVLNKKLLGPPINFPDWEVTYGFTDESVATLFKLKFS